MRLAVAVALGSILSAGCGSSSSSDGKATDSGATADGAIQDAPDDSTGSLQQGASCSVADDQCASGLRCCSEPTHMDPPSAEICVPPDPGGQCPLYP